MTRLLAALLSFGLLLLGGETALAQLPHTHGSDTDHSSHQGCPIHQLASHAIHLDGASPAPGGCDPALRSEAPPASPPPAAALTDRVASRGPPARTP